jgi:hypothetical protein
MKFFCILKSSTLHQLEGRKKMKDLKEVKIPGMQTRFVIKQIPGRTNTDDPIQLDLPLSFTPEKRV